MREAALYETKPDGSVRCRLCSHDCLIPQGDRGKCGVRENQAGTLFTLVYGRTITESVDPIEKKPLFHFYPGSTAYSIATPGCNFRCRWCQNWQISQAVRDQDLSAGRPAEPEQIVARAQAAGCRSIAYTYTEPTIFYEYALDTARRARAAGMANSFVSNGYMSAEMLKVFSPYLDAANIDLKSFRDETYREYVGARLKPVLMTLQRLKKYGIWLEVTTLVIPGINDSRAELTDAARFVVGELGPDTPWHLSAFYPAYQMMDTPLTPPDTLKQARELGLKEGLEYVYLGNVSGAGAENTVCPSCGLTLIERRNCRLLSNRVSGGRCPDCGTSISGVGL